MKYQFFISEKTVIEKAVSNSQEFVLKLNGNSAYDFFNTYKCKIENLKSIINY